jgi:hypothetical protein
MSYQDLMNDIHIAQRDAGEKAVIRHLEQQGLVAALNEPLKPKQMNTGDIAKAMYRAFGKCQHANDLRLARSQNVFGVFPSQLAWEELPPIERACWIAAASEAVAQVATMNAIQPSGE